MSLSMLVTGLKHRPISRGCQEELWRCGSALTRTPISRGESLGMKSFLLISR